MPAKASQPPTDVAPDPFDLEKVRQRAGNDPSFVTEVTLINVRQPGKAEFFRVHPSETMRVDGHLLEHGDERTQYWVGPGVDLDEVPEAYPVRIFVAASRHGHVFLWPAKKPKEDNQRGNSWSVSALLVAEKAQKVWVKRVTVRKESRYDAVAARADFGDPEWPADLNLRGLLVKGFRDCVINEFDHQVLRELRGEI